MSDNRLKLILEKLPKVSKEQDALFEQRYQSFMRDLNARPVEARMRSEPYRKPEPREPSPQMGLPGFGKVSGS